MLQGRADPRLRPNLSSSACTCAAPPPHSNLSGPTIKFHCDALIALGGAVFDATLDGAPVKTWWSSFNVKAGQELRIGSVHAETGVRGYLAVAGGIDVPLYLGSRSTFPGGQFGGYQGRYLRPGDSLPIGIPTAKSHPTALPKVGFVCWLNWLFCWLLCMRKRRTTTPAARCRRNQSCPPQTTPLPSPPSPPCLTTTRVGRTSTRVPCTPPASQAPPLLWWVSSLVLMPTLTTSPMTQSTCSTRHPTKCTTTPTGWAFV